MSSEKVVVITRRQGDEPTKKSLTRVGSSMDPPILKLENQEIEKRSEKGELRAYLGIPFGSLFIVKGRGAIQRRENQLRYFLCLLPFRDTI